MPRFKTVDEYVQAHATWLHELEKLVSILRRTRLEETIKWGAPCYVFQEKNVVGVGAFKNYFGLWFHQGAQLPDTANVLLNCQEGKTKALRQWRMTSRREIQSQLIRTYVREAIEIVEQGKEIKPARNKPIELPDELKTALELNANLKRSFGQLSFGKRREYAEYIRDAKRPTTKLSRLKKIQPMIESGVGLNDKYRR